MEVEGIQSMPPWMTKKLFIKFQELGEYFAKNNIFSPEIKEDLEKNLLNYLYRQSYILCHDSNRISKFLLEWKVKRKWSLREKI